MGAMLSFLFHKLTLAKSKTIQDIPCKLLKEARYSLSAESIDNRSGTFMVKQVSIYFSILTFPNIGQIYL